MRTALAIFAALLAGCSSMPPPGDGDYQVRLSELHGDVETGMSLIAITGDSCVLTVIGDLPTGITGTLTSGECTISLSGRE